MVMFGCMYVQYTYIATYLVIIPAIPMQPYVAVARGMRNFSIESLANRRYT